MPKFKEQTITVCDRRDGALGDKTTGQTSENESFERIVNSENLRINQHSGLSPIKIGLICSEYLVNSVRSKTIK